MRGVLTIERPRARPDQAFFVVEEAGRVVGWVHAALAEFVDSARFVLIGGLVVGAGHRKQGIGRMLIDRAEDWAREQGCSIVRLSSSVGRVEAHRFYERLGFTNIKTQLAFAKSLTPGEHDLGRLVPRIADGGRRTP